MTSSSAEYHKVWRAKHPTAAAEANRRYREAHPDRVVQQRAARKEATAAYGRVHLLRKRYGITTLEFEALLDEQGGVCAVCSTDQPGGRGTWHVDHDHETLVVRGLLCHPCNRGIGLLGDDPSRLLKAVSYLTKERA